MSSTVKMVLVGVVSFVAGGFILGAKPIRTRTLGKLSAGTYG